MKMEFQNIGVSIKKIPQICLAITKVLQDSEKFVMDREMIVFTKAKRNVWNLQNVLVLCTTLKGKVHALKSTKKNPIHFGSTKALVLSQFFEESQRYDNKNFKIHFDFCHAIHHIHDHTKINKYFKILALIC